MTPRIRVETFKGNVIIGLGTGIQRIQIRGVTKVCRVVGEQYIAIDNISSWEYEGDDA